jgi:hypothetical protein
MTEKVETRAITSTIGGIFKTSDDIQMNIIYIAGGCLVKYPVGPVLY